MTPLEKTLADALRLLLPYAESEIAAIAELAHDDESDEAADEHATASDVLDRARTALDMVDAMAGALTVGARVRIADNTHLRFRSLSGRQGVVTGATQYGFTVRFPGDKARYRTSVPREYLIRLDDAAPALAGVSP